jgi:hypothetical protein
LDLDFLLVAAGILSQVALVALLNVKRVSCRFRIFRTYLIFESLYGIIYLTIPANLGDVRISVWMAATVIDMLFYLAVLVELSRNTVRHNSISPPSRWLIFLLNLGIALAIWPAVQFRMVLNFPSLWHFSLHVLQFTTLLESAAFGTLVAWSGFSKLRWPDHEFRIVTGIGAWTIVSLGALMLHNDGFNGRANHWVDLFSPAAVLIVTLWWIQYFLFSPRQPDHPKTPVFEMAGGDSTN